MKKLLAVAVLAAFSTMSYAADKVLNADIVVVGQGAAGTAAAFAAAEKGKRSPAAQATSQKVFSLSAPRCSATTTFL